jgi:hypothetical protein
MMSPSNLAQFPQTVNLYCRDSCALSKDTKFVS